MPSSVQHSKFLVVASGFAIAGMLTSVCLLPLASTMTELQRKASGAVKPPHNNTIGDLNTSTSVVVYNMSLLPVLPSPSQSLTPPPSLSQLPQNVTTNPNVVLQQPLAPRDVCFGNRSGSMTLANYPLELAKISSPPHSASWNKMRNVLTSSKTFFIKLPPYFYDSTTENLVQMLKGFGLQRIPGNKLDSNKHNNTILLETSGAAIKKQVICRGQNCARLPRIAIQVEQQRPQLRQYLEKCHASPLCVIWEFSTYNYHWQSVQYNLQDSVMLVPHMIQNRLDSLAQGTPKPLAQRQYDVVLFGKKNAEREQLKKDLQKWHLNVRIGTELNVSNIAHAYREAKVCVIVHAHGRHTGGEYHRLTDFAKFGCVPVVETFADTDVGLLYLTNCAGLVSAPLPDLVPTVLRVLKEQIHFDNVQARIDWWNHGIDWSSLLPQIFGAQPR